MQCVRPSSKHQLHSRDTQIHAQSHPPQIAGPSFQRPLGPEEASETNGQSPTPEPRHRLHQRGSSQTPITGRAPPASQLLLFSSGHPIQPPILLALPPKEILALTSSHLLTLVPAPVIPHLDEHMLHAYHTHSYHTQLKGAFPPAAPASLQLRTKPPVPTMTRGPTRAAASLCPCFRLV